MDLAKLMSSIREHKEPHFNVWFGEEHKILEMYIDILAKGKRKLYVDSVELALKKIRVKSLDKTPLCIIVIDDGSFKSAENKWESIKKEFNQSKHTLILEYNKLDKTTKFYKRNTDCVVQFNKLTDDILDKYVIKELSDLSDDNREDLIKRCNSDYSLILLECDKIRQYSNYKNISQDTCYTILAKGNALYSEIGDITFDLVNAVLYGDLVKSAKYLEQAKQKGEPPILIASLLYRGFRNLLSVQGLGKNKKDAGKRTGLSGWEVKQVFDCIGGYSIKELERNMLLCQDIESGLKLGKYDDSLALDYLVVSCLT